MISRKIRAVFCPVSVFAVLLAFHSTVEAHAVLLQASPPQNGAVKGPDIAIRLKYNSRIDSSRSRLSVVLPEGTARALELDKQEAPDTLSSHSKGLKPGSYKLRWQVLASDGHVTRGEYSFEVK